MSKTEEGQHKLLSVISKAGEEALLRLKGLPSFLESVALEPDSDFRFNSNGELVVLECFNGTQADSILGALDHQLGLSEGDGKPVAPERPTLSREMCRNFAFRFWWKYVRKQWPPAEPIPPFPQWVQNKWSTFRYRMALSAYRTQYVQYLSERGRIEGAAETSSDSLAYNLGKVIDQVKPELIQFFSLRDAYRYLLQVEASGIPFVVSLFGDAMGDSLLEWRDGNPIPRVAASASLLLVESRAQEQWLVENGCSRDNIRLVRPSIDVEKIDFVQRTAPESGEWVLLHDSDWAPSKGLETALLAFANARKEFANARLIVCGSGEHVSKLRNFADALGLASSVEFFGQLSDQEKSRIYSKAHMMVQASESRADGTAEGLPLALLEGMAMGIPFITTFHGGNAEVFTDATGGRLVPEGSAEDLARAMTSLMGDPAFFEDCSKAARALVEDACSSEVNTQVVDSLYENVLGLLTPLGHREVRKLYRERHYDAALVLSEPAYCKDHASVEILETRARSYNKTNQRAKALDAWSNYHQEATTQAVADISIPPSAQRHIEDLQRKERELAAGTEPLPGRQLTIAGLSYSGSTVLSLLLGRIPGAANLGESFWLTRRRLDNKPEINPDKPDEEGVQYCEHCGPDCKALPWAFRSELAQDSTRWREKLLKQMGADLLITSDKHREKLNYIDPLNRYDAIVLFKDPLQAWWSHYRKTSTNLEGFNPTKELDLFFLRYIEDHEHFLDDFQNEGKLAFLFFDEFCLSPREHMKSLCEIFSLPYDDALFEDSDIVQHTFGGNAGVNSQGSLRIRQVPEHKLPEDQVEKIQNNFHLTHVFQRCLDRYHQDFRTGRQL